MSDVKFSSFHLDGAIGNLVEKFFIACCWRYFIWV